MMEGLGESSSEKRKSNFSDEDTPVAKKQRCPILGIDLGTTFSCIAVFENGHPEVIPNTDGQRTTPSVVHYNDGKIIVGNAANDAAKSNTCNTIYDAKRLIGRKFDDSDIQDDLKHWLFKVVDQDNKCFIALEDNTLIDPVDVSSEVLKYLKRVAEEYLGVEVSDAVITVPAYFDDLQRKATKDAGFKAGFEKIDLLNEPTAAAIAFGEKNKSSEEEEPKNIVVYDLGGGTFDISFLIHARNDYSVKCINGANHLGGEDFTNALVSHCLNFLELNRDTASNYLLGFLKEECEKTKCLLSTRDSRSINVPVEGGITVIEITRDSFEKLVNEHILTIMEKVMKTVADSGFSVDEVDDIIMVGGSSRIPTLQRHLENYFGKKVKKTINADESVAIGAAIAGVKIFSNSQTELESIELVDVTPLSIGVQLRGGIMDQIIARNSKIPVTKAKNYTARPKKEGLYDLEIKIFQGERLLTADNTFLGKLVLDNLTYDVEIPPSVSIEITISQNGTCKITAKDNQSNIEREVILQDIYQPQYSVIIQKSEENRSQDNAKVMAIRAQYKLEDLCYRCLAKLNCSTDNAHNDLKEEISDIIKTIPALDLESIEMKMEYLKKKLN